MKRFQPILALALILLAGCTSEIYETKEDQGKDTPKGELDEAKAQAIIKNITDIGEYDVPVKEGHITVVTYNSDTLAVTDEPMTIWVPKSAVATKAQSGLQTHYIDGNDPDAAAEIKNLKAPGNVGHIWQTIAFEDSYVGDYDYNDLVIHPKYSLSSSGILKIGIHPIALGGTKQIGLGFKVFQKGEQVGKDIIVTENCREELFDGMEGFINTVKFNHHWEGFKWTKKDIKIDPKKGAPSIIWFIKIDQNARLYSVNDKFGSLDANYRPYGLVITETGKTYVQDDQKGVVGWNWFTYPKETCNISDCYPSFDKWLRGEGSLSHEDDELQNVFNINDESDGDAKRIYVVPNGNTGL